MLPGRHGQTPWLSNRLVTDSEQVNLKHRVSTVLVFTPALHGLNDGLSAEGMTACYTDE